MNRAPLSRLYAPVMASAQLPVMNLQRFRRITDGRYSAIFAGAEVGPKFSFADYNAAVVAMTEQKFGIVEGSLYQIDEAHLPMFRCILAGNVETKEYDDKLTGYKAVHANVFSDSDDNLWRLVGSGDKKHLVQMTGDDFDKILDAKRLRNPVVANYNEIVPFEDGDYVRYLNQNTAELDFGFVNIRQDGDFVFSRAQPEKLIRILPDQVVEAAAIPVVQVDGNNMPGPATWRRATLAAGDYSPKAYLDYMRSLFAGTAFFKALEDAIKQNGVS